MTCDPVAYLQASKQIQAIAADEGCYRAATSRAYYAAYHCCRLYYAALPHLSNLAGSGMHEQLINALILPSKKLSGNAQARSAALGKYLRDMCGARVHADYRPEEIFSADKMADSISTAEMIFEAASVSKGALVQTASPLAQA